MGRLNKQRRPEGYLRQCTDTFRKALVLKIDFEGVSARDIAHLLTEQGVPTHETTISNLRRGKYPSSRLVEPICKLFNWPLPPYPGEDESEAEAVSDLKYLSNSNRESYEKLIRLIKKSAANQRALDAADSDD